MCRVNNVKVTYSADSAAVDQRLVEIIDPESEIKMRWQPGLRKIGRAHV